MLLSITEFIGHFHPLIVHLPIGILLIALLLQWLSGKEKYQSFQGAVPFLLLCGMISAIGACISGYFLSVSDDYNDTIVGWHKWMGFSVAGVSVILYAKEKKIRFAAGLKYLSLMLFVLIMVTGHLGGLLTHGSDYLTGPLMDVFGDEKLAGNVIKPVPNVQEAHAYADVIKPILQTKCYSCHGPNKQKGGLRMDDSLKLLKGGKDGIVLHPNNADESELIERMLLPVDNDDHMPPKEKPQPTESQIALLYWWISSGADFNKKVRELNPPDKLKPILLALQEEPEIKIKMASVPQEPVEPADDKIIERLKDRGIIVLPVARGSNYLLANFITDSVITNEDLDLLLSLKKQLVWLKMGFTDINDEKLVKIKQLPNLMRLSIEHTSVTDKGVEQLRSNNRLQYLNVVGTGVTANGIMHLKELKELQSVYVYQAKIDKSDWPALKKALPDTRIDSGGYSVPTLESDTTEVKVSLTK